MRKLVAVSDQFDTATSTRRFVIGAPDGGNGKGMMALRAEVGRTAPGIGLAVFSVLPANTGWTNAFAMLDGMSRYCLLPRSPALPTHQRSSWWDVIFAEFGWSRRVAVAVPNFIMALEIVAYYDLLIFVPDLLLQAQSRHFDLTSTKLPLDIPQSRVHAVVPKAGLTDAGLVWRLTMIERSFADQVVHKNNKLRGDAAA